jgi:DNA transposition AAA+ family ATPase
MRKIKVAKIIKKGQITINAKYKIIIKSFKELGGILNNYAIKNRPIEEVIEMENNVASEMFSK